jgi:hypothetical protein
VPPSPDNTVAIVAIAVSGGVGIGAALIAAVSAGHRQRRALDAEGERLRNQLGAETERLDLQLAHDRELEDLRELRAKLDEIGVLQAQAVDNLFNSKAWLQSGDRAQSQTALDSAGQPIRQLAFQNQMVMLRVTADHELPTKVNGHRHALEKTFDYLKECLSTDASLDESRWEELEQTFAGQQLELIEAVRQHVGSRLRDDNGS